MKRLALVGVLAALSSCSSSSSDKSSGHASDGGDAAPVSSWRQVFTGLPGALISVWGTSSTDVWAVGSDTHDGRGPLVLHFDGTRWVRRVASASGDLWWVHGFANGPVFAGGSNGAVFRYDKDSNGTGGHFTAVPAPKTKGTVFGIWGTSAKDVWAVGGDTTFGTGSFVWHSDGTAFVEWTDLPVDAKTFSAFFKVWGTSATDAWVVGSGGVTLHYDGKGFSHVAAPVADPLFTVHVAPGGRRTAVVGGFDLGVLLERNGASDWQAASLPDGTRQLFGVALTSSSGWAVGADTAVLSGASGAWKREKTGLVADKALHAVWVDPENGVWAVGGDVLTPPLGAGTLVHLGKAVPTTYTLEASETFDAGADASVGSGGSGGAGPIGGSGGRSGTGGAGGVGGSYPIRDGGQRDAAPDVSVPDATPQGSGGFSGTGGAPGMGGTVDAGPPSSFGKVQCGASTCMLPAEKCCADAGTGVPSGCVAAGAACLGSEAEVTCDESGDCASGQCCLDREFQGGVLLDIQCAPSCFGPVACVSNGGCTTGECLSFIPMPSYQVCQ